MERGDRCFTVAEANALLPRLAEWLPRLRELIREVRSAATEIERLIAVGHTEDGVLIMAHDYRLTRQRLERRRNECSVLIGELRRLGVQIKDLEAGLVDFPATVAGRDVLLCWRLGEPAVAFYHDYADGFAGRRPIPPDTP